VDAGDAVWDGEGCSLGSLERVEVAPVPVEAAIVRRGLEELLRSIDAELARVEARLEALAERLGLASREELEAFFGRRGIDSPEADLAWPEYVHLRERLGRLREERRQVLNLLSRGASGAEARKGSRAGEGAPGRV
jgi:hypothetical protein